MFSRISGGLYLSVFSLGASWLQLCGSSDSLTGEWSLKTLSVSPKGPKKNKSRRDQTTTVTLGFFLGGGWVLVAVCDDLAKVIKQEIDYQCRNVRMQSSLHCLFLQQTCPWGNVFEHNSKQHEPRWLWVIISRCQSDTLITFRGLMKVDEQRLLGVSVGQIRKSSGL